MFFVKSIISVSNSHAVVTWEDSLIDAKEFDSSEWASTGVVNAVIGSSYKVRWPPSREPRSTLEEKDGVKAMIDDWLAENKNSDEVKLDLQQLCDVIDLTCDDESLASTVLLPIREEDDEEDSDASSIVYETDAEAKADGVPVEEKVRHVFNRHTISFGYASKAMRWAIKTTGPDYHDRHYRAQGVFHATAGAIHDALLYFGGSCLIADLQFAHWRDYTHAGGITKSSGILLDEFVTFGEQKALLVGAQIEDMDARRQYQDCINHAISDALYHLNRLRHKIMHDLLMKPFSYDQRKELGKATALEMSRFFIMYPGNKIPVHNPDQYPADLLTKWEFEDELPMHVPSSMFLFTRIVAAMAAAENLALL